jgi:hypothetical protein
MRLFIFVSLTGMTRGLSRLLPTFRKELLNQTPPGKYDAGDVKSCLNLRAEGFDIEKRALLSSTAGPVQGGRAAGAQLTVGSTTGREETDETHNCSGPGYLFNR